MSKDVTRNQRRHVRVVPKGMSSRVRVGGALHIGLATENLSLGGAFVRCAQSPPLRTHATLELVVPGVNQPLLLPGTVAFVISQAEAQSQKRSAGFAIEFARPLPPHLQKGLQRLIESIDPKALIPLDTRAPPPVADEEEEAQTQSVPVFVPAVDPEELQLLKRLVATQEKELKRLQRENEQLKATITKLQSGR